MRFDELIIDIETDPERKVVVAPDGRVMSEALVTVTEEASERMRLGYLCMRCYEDLTPLGPFPEECPVCRYRVREHQPAEYGRNFKGEVIVGSRLSLSDEAERLREMDIWTPDQGGI